MTITNKQLERVKSIVNFNYTNRTATEIAWLNSQVKIIIKEKGSLFWMSEPLDISDEATFTRLLIQGLTELKNI